MPKPTFLSRMRQLRLKEGYSQPELADVLQCHTSYVSQMERGVKKPSGTMLIRLGEALHCSIDYLLGRKNERGEESFETIAQSEEDTEQDFQDEQEDVTPSPWEPGNE